MYDVVILNFGDNDRVFYDAFGAPVMVKIGEMKECSLTEATAKTLFASQRSDSICLMRKHVQLPDKVIQMFDLLTVAMTNPYESVLSEAAALVGRERFSEPRPTRNVIRTVVGQAARALCAEYAPITPLEELAGTADESGDVEPEEAEEQPDLRPMRRARIKMPTKSKAKAKKTKKSLQRAARRR